TALGGTALTDKIEDLDGHTEVTLSPAQGPKGVGRREFFAMGVAAGAGATVSTAPGAAHAAAGGGAQEWDCDADIVVGGGGGAGLTAAIRARDLGASVLVIYQNFDLGGRMLHSGAFTSLGGGDPIQVRDMEGRSDPEGRIAV